MFSLPKVNTKSCRPKILKIEIFPKSSIYLNLKPNM